MNFKILTLFVAFALAGSHLSSLQASFERDIVSGNINSLKSLIKNNVNLIDNPEGDQHRDKLLLLAVKKRQTDVVDLLLQKLKVNAASNDNEAIREASMNGDAAIVKLLLSRPEINPGAKDNEAIIMATIKGHTEVVRQLLANPKVDPTARASQAFFWASNFHYPDIVKLFILDGRNDLTDLQLYSLESAAQFENVDLVQFLISQPIFSQNRLFIDKIIVTGGLRQIRTFVEAGYKIDKEILDEALVIARENNRDDKVEYLEYLIKGKNILPSKPLFQMTDECGICLQKDSLFNGYMADCQHQFHGDCLQRWVHSHNSCPMCRAAVI